MKSCGYQNLNGVELKNGEGKIIIFYKLCFFFLDSKTYPLRSAQRNLNKSLFGAAYDSSSENKSTAAAAAHISKNNQSPESGGSGSGDIVYQHCKSEFTDFGHHMAPSSAAMSSTANGSNCVELAASTSSTISNNNNRLNNAYKELNHHQGVLSSATVSSVASTSATEIKSDSDSSREDGFALKNDVKLSQPSLFSSNLHHQNSKKSGNALISDLSMANFSPVDLPQVGHHDHGKFFWFFSFIYFAIVINISMLFFA